MLCTASPRAYGHFSPSWPSKGLLQKPTHPRPQQRTGHIKAISTSTASVSRASRPQRLNKCSSHQVRAQSAATLEAATDIKQDPATDTSGPFNWYQQWYPVYIEADLDAAKPKAITLLNIQMVLWKDGTGTWRAFRDRCPHRLAALSEGRVEEDGSLQCSYHGYRFDGSGKCTHIPHAKDEAAHAAAIASPRGCVESFPCKIHQGMLWVWPDSSPTAQQESACSSLYGKDFPDEVDGKVDGQPVNETMLVYREMPYDIETLLENLSDPGHVPFSHHGILGNRYTVPLGAYDMHSAEQQTPWQLAVTFNDALGTPQLLAYDPPCRMQSTFPIPEKMGGGVAKLTFFCVPVSPGKSIAIINFRTTSQHVAFKMSSVLPKWFDHAVIRLAVVEGDSIFLHNQEHVIVQQLQSENAPKWSRFFWLPTSADLMVKQIREWLSDPAKGGGGPWGPGRYEHWPPQTLERSVILDRYETHTKHCKACSAAYHRFGIAYQIAYVAAVICAAIAACTTVLLVSGQQSMKCALGSVTLPVAVVCAALSGAFAFVSIKLKAFRRKFVFEDYVHAERH